MGARCDLRQSNFIHQQACLTASYWDVSTRAHVCTITLDGASDVTRSFAFPGYSLLSPFNFKGFLLPCDRVRLIGSNKKIAMLRTCGPRSVS